MSKTATTKGNLFRFICWFKGHDYGPDNRWIECDRCNGRRAA